jgi:CDP-glucose 4,6-dehydratase
MYSGIYKNKIVLVTGCCGFKASWVCCWLEKLGATVIEYGHNPNTDPNHYTLLGRKSFGNDDTLDKERLKKVFSECKPDIIFHFAAKAIVARSFREPLLTIENNVQGAANVLEVARLSSTKGAVVVTSDKVYKDENWIWGYRENDTLGGYDPYSTSKVCIEHIIEMYRHSFGMNIATARAGNVIGGGDWSEKRLIPDIVKATAEGKKVIIKSPNATRPWQHILSALDGYLLLGEQILKGNYVNSAWNFGPTEEMSVIEVLKVAKEHWSEIEWEITPQETHPHMVNLLKIDSTKARKFLGWNPPWNLEETIARTINWYRSYYQEGSILTQSDICDYERRDYGL